MRRLGSRRAGGRLLVWLGLGTAVLGMTAAGASGFNQVECGFCGVAVASPKQAWAVGHGFGIERWNGRSWHRVHRSPRASLLSVTAISSADAWAVGYRLRKGGRFRTVIYHWTGGTWHLVSSPDPSLAAISSGCVSCFTQHFLAGVAGTSPTDVWAVGDYLEPFITPTGQTSSHGAPQALIEHWDGSSWTKVPSGAPGQPNLLYGVAAASTTDAWAVGSHNGTTLALHWDGSSWSRVTSPSPGGVSRQDELNGVAATSASDAWAVGDSAPTRGTRARTIIEHWNGFAWQTIASPNPGGRSGFSALEGVAATSPSDAWAVGYYQVKHRLPRPLIMHWNGSRWNRIGKSDSGVYLNAVAIVSPTEALSVGDIDPFAHRARPLLTLHLQ